MLLKIYLWNLQDIYYLRSRQKQVPILIWQPMVVGGKPMKCMKITFLEPFGISIIYSCRDKTQFQMDTYITQIMSNCH